MAAGNTYTQIASTTLGSNASSVTFSSIAGTYTDLVIAVNYIAAGSANSDGFYCQFNGDTSTNYSSTLLSGNGTTASSSRTSNASNIFMAPPTGYLSNTNPSAIIIQINNYSNATTYKTYLGRANLASSFTQAAAALWRSTSAISSIEFFGVGSKTSVMGAGTTISLYGITAA